MGVEIELPEADAAPMEQSDEPVVVNVMANGDLYLSIDGSAELIDEETLVSKMAAFVRRNPEVQVLIGGDREVDYGRVYAAMVALQHAGVERIGLMSDPLEN
jgi:biopolymer transport protein TolR